MEPKQLCQTNHHTTTHGAKIAKKISKPNGKARIIRLFINKDEIKQIYNQNLEINIEAIITHANVKLTAKAGNVKCGSAPQQEKPNTTPKNKHI